MNKVQKTAPMVKKLADKRELILVAAEKIIAERGLKALKVRDVALAAKASLGGVYLFFEDLDALVIAVNRRTLIRLDTTLAATSGTDPQTEIHALSRAYLEFAASEPNLLRSMFEHRMAEDRHFPPDLLTEINDAFARIAIPLALILKDETASDAAIMARTMFSAFHGIVTMGIEERVVAVPLPRLREQVALFVNAFLSGLPESLHKRPNPKPIKDENRSR